MGSDAPAGIETWLRCAMDEDFRGGVGLAALHTDLSQAEWPVRLAQWASDLGKCAIEPFGAHH